MKRINEADEEMKHNEESLFSQEVRVDQAEGELSEPLLIVKANLH